MNRTFRNLLLVSLAMTILLSLFLIRKREFPDIEITQREERSLLPEADESLNEKQSLSLLTGHFPDRVIPVTEEKRYEPVVEVELEPRLSDEIKYLSTIVSEDIESYYFKLIRSGKLIILTESENDSQWSLVSADDNGFIIGKGPDKYKVLKK